MKEMFVSAWDVLLRFTGAAGGVIGGGSLPLMAVLMGLNLLLSLFADRSKPKRRLKAFRDIGGKASVLGIVLLAGWLDGISGKGNTMKNAVIGYYICNEGLALIKTASALGVPVPSVLQKALNSLRASEQADENIWLPEKKET